MHTYVFSLVKYIYIYITVLKDIYITLRDQSINLYLH
jgi:hypothetical protein